MRNKNTDSAKKALEGYRYAKAVWDRQLEPGNPWRHIIFKLVHALENLIEDQDKGVDNMPKKDGTGPPRKSGGSHDGRGDGKGRAPGKGTGSKTGGKKGKC